MLFPDTIFCEHVKGSLTPLSRRFKSSAQPLQQAENGEINTKNTAHNNPIGQPKIIRMMNQIMLHSHPQLAIAIIDVKYLETVDTINLVQVKIMETSNLLDKN